MLETTTKINVDTGSASVTLKSLREEIKASKEAMLNAAEGSEAYSKALQNAADKAFQLREMQEQIRGRANDLGEMLNNGTKVLGGLASGYAAAQGAMNLFGIESEGLEKQLVKVQSAIAIMSGLQGLEGLGKTVLNLGSQLAAFVASSGPVGLAIAAVTALGTAVYFLVDAYNDETDAAEMAKVAVDGTIHTSIEAKDAYEKQLLMMQKLNTEYDLLTGKVSNYELKIAEATKKRDEELAKINLARTTSIIAGALLPGETPEQKLERIQKETDAKIASINAIYEAEVRNLTQLEINRQKSSSSLVGSGNKMSTKSFALNEMTQPEGTSEAEDALAAQMALDTQMIENAESTAGMLGDIYRGSARGIKEAFRDGTAIAKSSFSAVADLAEVFAGKSEKSQRKAFEVQKAANIANATIDTITGAIAVYKSLAGITVVGHALGIAAAAAATASGLANIKRIEQTRFNGGTNSPGIGNTNPNVNLIAPSYPKQQTGATNVNVTGASGIDYLQQPIRAYVVESDISSVQKKVSNLEKEASF